MKKLLLSVATALLSTAAVCAQDLPQIYVLRDTVASAEELTTGKYVITVKSSGVPTSGLYRRAGQQVIGIFGSAYENVVEAGDKGRAYFTNPGYVWNIDVNEEKKFTIQSIIDNMYFSCRGSGAPNGFTFENSARFAPYGTEGGGITPETTAGLFKIYSEEQTPDFTIQLTNAKFNVSPKHDNPCLYTTNVVNDAPAGTNKNISYWGSPEAGDKGGLTFMFTLAELATEDDFVDITVSTPEWNGAPIVKTFKCLKGANVTPFVSEYIGGLGGMTGITLKSAGDDPTDMIATEDNTQFVIEGDWVCDFEPYEVYRVVVSPYAEKTSALRYMIQDENIRTRLDDKSGSVARIVPERLWYFDPVEGEPLHFYMRTLYDTTKGVTYTEPYANGQDAQLTENPTKLELISKDELVQDGVHYPQFFMKIVGSDNYCLNDFGGDNNTAGTLKLIQNPTDNGSLIRLYPLDATDKQMIGLDANAEALATNEEFVAAVTAWNEQNVRAALRRIEFWGSKNLIGNNPGQINNPAGDLEEKYAEAQEVAANLDNGSEQYDTDYLNELTAALDWTKFDVNPVLPNRFYRFKNVTSGKYISSTYYTDASKMDLTEDGNRSNTVFFNMEQDGEKLLVCYDNGLVFNKFAKNTSWIPVLATNTGSRADNFVFTSRDNAAFTIHISGNIESAADADHRHLHGAGNSVNCSGNNNTDNNDHYWYVENVDLLPITFYNIINDQAEYGDEGWASVYAPVALEVPQNGHLTAYTGQFDDKDYSEVNDVNHILATPIEPNEDGKVIIPAGQVALIFYDGEADIEHDPDFDPSLMAQRSALTYAYLPIVYDYEGTSAPVGNLQGSYLAFGRESGKEYYTLHASYNNYFRQYSEYQSAYTYVPGFKAYIPMAENGEEYFQLSTINPNTMVPQVTGTEGTQGIAVEKAGEGQHKVTITMPDENYVVYYKHTPFEAAEENQPQQVRRRAAAEGFEEAEKSGNEHTFTKGPGAVEYYAYHTPTNTTSAVRSFDLTTEGEAMPTSIKSVMVNMNGKQVIFDLQGRRMAAPVKGINIVNNKKVLVK